MTIEIKGAIVFASFDRAEEAGEAGKCGLVNVLVKLGLRERRLRTAIVARESVWPGSGRTKLEKIAKYAYQINRAQVIMIIIPLENNNTTHCILLKIRANIARQKNVECQPGPRLDAECPKVYRKISP